MPGAPVFLATVNVVLASSTSRPAGAAQSPELLDLVDRARIGNLDAQSDLVRRYTPRIAGFVRPMISQPSSVEDVVQTVFIKMVRRLRLLRTSAAFESWLFRLARNTALDFIRRRRCRPITVADERQMADVIDPSCTRTMDEIMEAFELAIARLSPMDRRLVRMVVQGHSYSIVAAAAGLTVGAVKVRLCRVRPFLRCSVGGAIGPDATERNLFPTGRRRLAA